MQNGKAFLLALILLQAAVRAEEAPTLPKDAPGATTLPGMPATVGLQAAAGLGVGSLAALATTGMVVFAMPCGDRKERDEEGSMDPDYSCLGTAMVASVVGTGAFAIGNSIGIHGAGKYMGRQGGFIATLVGTAAGMALGALAVQQLEDYPVMATAAFLTISQSVPLFFYHTSDRFQASASFTQDGPAFAGKMVVARF